MKIDYRSIFCEVVAETILTAGPFPLPSQSRAALDAIYKEGEEILNNLHELDGMSEDEARKEIAEQLRFAMLAALGVSMH